MQQFPGILFLQSNMPRKPFTHKKEDHDAFVTIHRSLFAWVYLTIHT